VFLLIQEQRLKSFHRSYTLLSLTARQNVGYVVCCLVRYDVTRDKTDKLLRNFTYKWQGKNSEV